MRRRDVTFRALCCHPLKVGGLGWSEEGGGRFEALRHSREQEVKVARMSFKHLLAASFCVTMASCACLLCCAHPLGGSESIRVVKVSSSAVQARALRKSRAQIQVSMAARESCTQGNWAKSSDCLPALTSWLGHVCGAGSGTRMAT